MSDRTCKTCKVNKERNYFTLDGRARCVYKDDEGYIWHGKVCGPCFTGYVKVKANKKPLEERQCARCGSMFKQKVINQRVCSKDCCKPLV